MGGGLLGRAVDTATAAVQALDPREPDDSQVPMLDGKTAIVTGGNSGLGYEAGLAMAKAGAHVILACRSTDRGDEAVESIEAAVKEAGNSGTVETLHIDVADLRTVHSFAEAFLKRNKPLHILINNAGEFVPDDRVTKDGFGVLPGTNHFGPWYLTQLLVPALKRGGPSRLVWVSSPSETNTPDIDFDNLEGTGVQQDLALYGLTKLYNILSMKEFHTRLEADGVEAFAAQPGIANTELFGKIHPEASKPIGSAIKAAGPKVGQSQDKGAAALLYAATSQNMSGKGGDVEHIVGPFYSFSPGKGLANITNVGNTGERAALNERAYNDDVSEHLYESTGRILSEKTSAWDSGRTWA